MAASMTATTTTTTTTTTRAPLSQRQFASTVSRILQRLEQSADDIDSAAAMYGDGPLLSSELSDLLLLCTVQQQHASTPIKTLTLAATKPLVGFTEVETDALLALLAALDQQVQAALMSKQSLIEQALQVLQHQQFGHDKPGTALQKWLAPDASGHARVMQVRRALEAANVMLCIMATPGLDRRVLSEDALDHVVALCRRQLKQHAVPAFNETGHLTKKTHQDNGLSPPGSPPASKKRRRSDATPTAVDASLKHLAREIKAFYPGLIQQTVPPLLHLLERWLPLIECVPLEDAAVLQLSAAAWAALSIECVVTQGVSTQVPLPHQTQTSCIMLLTALFGRYPQHRESLLEDAFGMMLQLPSSKKTLRAWPLRYVAAAAPSSLAARNGYLLHPLLPHLVPSSPLKAASSWSSQPGATMVPPHHIQTMTALVLQLVQACVQQPSYITSTQIADNGGAVAEVQFQSGLQDCQVVCAAFAAQLLGRCSNQNSTTPTTPGSRKSMGPSEFRPFLLNLVDDLLLCLLVPELPAADMLLHALLRHLSADLTKASPFSGTVPAVSMELTYLNSAFDILGKVCAVEARLIAADRDAPLRITSPKAPLTNDRGGAVLQCLCGESYTDGVLCVNCDACGVFYHGPCVGITNLALPEEWHCDGCRLKHIADRTKRHFDSEVPAELTAQLIDDVFALHGAGMANLSHRWGVESKISLPAKRFHLAAWAEELDQKVKQTADGMPYCQQIITNLLSAWDGATYTGTLGVSVPGAVSIGEPLTEEGSVRATIATVVRTSRLSISFRGQISFLLKLMSDKAPATWRKLSLKSIEKAAEGDPDLMLMRAITKAVAHRLTDETISVREAALSLVGSYVVQFPAIANAFHASLLSCLSDFGVSVRKRAIRIFQAILTSNPRYKGRAAACDMLLRLAVDPKEEDGVRDAIYSLFTTLWLQNGSNTVTAPSSPPRDRSSPNDKSPGRALLTSPAMGTTTFVTPTPPAVHSRMSTQAEFAAVQMMEVVRGARTGSHLELFLKKLLQKSAANPESKQMDNMGADPRQFGLLVDSLFELLVSIEEQQAGRARVTKDIAATLMTVAVMTEVSPGAVFRHVDTVLPYLKADGTTEDDSMLVAATCDIVHRLATYLDDRHSGRLLSGALARDLIQVTYKFGTGAMASAVEALSAVSHLVDDSVVSKKYLELARSFYSYLFKKKDDDAPQQAKLRNNIHRALTVLGLVCQHQKVETSSLDDIIVDPSDLQWNNLPGSCYRLFSVYLRSDDIGTKCKSLRALGGIFMSQPRLLLELKNNGLVDDVMAKNAPISIQYEALQCWKNILLAEEKRIDGGRAQEQLEQNEQISTSNRISGDQDGDATLFGGVLTTHSERLFEMTRATEFRIRMAALELIGLLLRQGLVNPNDAVPFLYAMQGDIDHTDIRSCALRFLIAEGEKRPDMLRQRACVGVKEAYRFQRVVYKTKETSALLPGPAGQQVECIFGRVFKESIASSRKQRHGLFKNLLTMFTATTNNETAPDLALAAFAAQILAHLPYSTSEDPLFVIYWIGKSMGVQASELLEQLADVLRPVGLSNADELDESNTGADALERAAFTKIPARTQEAAALASDKFDLRRFAGLCQNAAAIVLLLRLKQFLRKTYNLSELRCLEYDPSAKEKDRIGDKLSVRAIIPAPFEVDMPLAGSATASSYKHIDKTALIRQYAEFRRLMRDENAGDLDLIDSDDDGKLANHAGQKRPADDPV